jgi:hypothetical protein
MSSRGRLLLADRFVSFNGAEREDLCWKLRIDSVGDDGCWRALDPKLLVWRIWVSLILGLADLAFANLAFADLVSLIWFR